MKVKVLGVGLGRPVILGAILQLAKEHDWELCYCIDFPEYEGDINSGFPNCYFHSVYKAVKGIPHPALSYLSAHTIDAAFRGVWSEYESMTIRMIDRFDPWSSCSYHERIDLFRSMCRYWTGVLDLIKPDVVLFVTTPHVPCEYVLYGLAHARGIKVIFFHHTALPGYIFAANSLDGPTPFLSRYDFMAANGVREGDGLPQALEEYVSRVLGGYAEAMPQDLKDWLPSSGWMSDLSRIAKYYLDIHLYIDFLRGSETYYKERFRSLGQSRIGSIERQAYKYAAKLKIWRQRRDYRRRAVAPDLDVPFVYVALHYQPEATTWPDGGAFFDQRDVIDVLSSTIPEGWYLYVKEHPAQFSGVLAAMMGRDLRLYVDIASYPNVRLVPADYDSFRLIDAAKAVATVTGTVGWEAIIRGTPALVFGYAWYREFEGVFYVPSHELCKRAIEAIRSGYQVDHHRVRLWIRAMQESCVKAFVEVYDEQRPGYSREENVQTLARAIFDSYTVLRPGCV